MVNDVLNGLTNKARTTSHKDHTLLKDKEKRRKNEGKRMKGAHEVRNVRNETRELK